MKQNRDIRFPKVAIIDWGIGGISFYRILKAHYTTLPVVYFSDSGTTPYGKQSRSQLRSRLINIIHYLSNRGTGYLVVAGFIERCIGNIVLVKIKILMEKQADLP